MNFSKKGTAKKYKQYTTSTRRIKSKTGVLFFKTFLIFLVLIVCIGTFAGIGFVKGIIDNAPDITTITVAPTEFLTKIYDSEGNQTQQLVGSNGNRVYVKIDKIPQDVIDAFVAIEDERFWEHNGIDIRGIFRAFFTGITGGFDQGASTITQQLLKNRVFEGGMETNMSDKIERKIQEQYLAVQLENIMDKETILEYYLNTINLGQNTLGVEAASQRYFGKSVSELTLSEATVIAGITKNPSSLNPISYPEKNAERRQTILFKMREQGYISEEEYQEALQDDVYERIQLHNEEYISNASVNSYFVDELIEQITADLVEHLGYNSTQAYNLLYRGGLKIYTTQNSELQSICDEVIADESLYPASSTYELTYRLTVMDENDEAHNYSEYDLRSYFRAKNSKFDLYFKNKDDATPYIEEFRKSVVTDTDKIDGENIAFTIQPQVSFVLMDQATGQVKAIVGGRGTKMASRTLNRATNTLRQPGSTFKILSTFLPALDTKGMTLTSVQDDCEYYYPGTTRKVNNWNGNKYNGLSTIRQAIMNSMNVVSVKTLEQVTPQTGFSYLQKLGFTSLVENRTDENTNHVYSDVNLSLALGGITDGVSNLELTNAYASIANGGIYTKPVFYTKIVDHNGKILLENKPETSQVMKESTAWLLTNAMQDVVTTGTGKKVAFLNKSMPIAGKTGTTSNDYDLWFVGYTPYYTAGIWGGYDNNFDQDDSTYTKVIWRTIMERIHKNLERKEFTKPDSIVSAKVCTKSGKLAVEGVCDHALGGSTVRTEYFAKGTQPMEACDIHVKVNVCAESLQTPSAHCPSIIQKVFLAKPEEKCTTADTPNILPKDFETKICKIHANGANLSEVTDPIQEGEEELEKPNKPNAPNEGNQGNNDTTANDNTGSEADSANAPNIPIVPETPEQAPDNSENQTRLRFW